MYTLFQYLEDYNLKPYFSEKGDKLCKCASQMIIDEYYKMKDEHKIVLPLCGIQLVDSGVTNARSVKIEDEYWIFVDKRVLEEQRERLIKLKWAFLENIEEKKAYVDKIIEYGFYFSVFHEYSHILCGHCDAGLSDNADKRAQEYEADIVAMDYLKKYILVHTGICGYMEEVMKLFFACYFLFKQIEKENKSDLYNSKKLTNYYMEEMRDHPLSVQRCLYLYELLNIILVTDQGMFVSIKQEIIKILMILKDLTDEELPNLDNRYPCVEESINRLKASLKIIRVKIPRMGKFEM